jgi:hypothetical protein
MSAGAKELADEEKFRRVLEDVRDVTEKLSTFCKTVEELHAMCVHGLENEAQLRLLMAVMTAKR